MRDNTEMDNLKPSSETQVETQGSDEQSNPIGIVGALAKEKRQVQGRKEEEPSPAPKIRRIQEQRVKSRVLSLGNGTRIALLALGIGTVGAMISNRFQEPQMMALSQRINEGSMLNPSEKLPQIVYENISVGDGLICNLVVTFRPDVGRNGQNRYSPMVDVVIDSLQDNENGTSNNVHCRIEPKVTYVNNSPTYGITASAFSPFKSTVDPTHGKYILDHMSSDLKASDMSDLDTKLNMFATSDPSAFARLQSASPEEIRSIAGSIIERSITLDGPDAPGFLDTAVSVK